MTRCCTLQTSKRNYLAIPFWASACQHEKLSCPPTFWASITFFYDTFWTPNMTSSFVGACCIPLKRRRRGVLSKQWKLIKSLKNIFKHWSAGTSMSIFEIQLCGKDEYAEHYEHGTEPRLVQQKRSRYSKEWNLLRLQTLHWQLALYGFCKIWASEISEAWACKPCQQVLLT